ncbi:MAG: hypothetical protein ACR2KL_05605 [Nocardioidaceae bacterium]
MQHLLLAFELRDENVLGGTDGLVVVAELVEVVVDLALRQEVPQRWRSLSEVVGSRLLVAAVEVVDPGVVRRDGVTPGPRAPRGEGSCLEDVLSVLDDLLVGSAQRRFEDAAGGCHRVRVPGQHSTTRRGDRLGLRLGLGGSLVHRGRCRLIGRKQSHER